MKKKIFGGIAVLAIAAMAAFNLNLSVGNNHSSSLSLMNIEALANGENKNCTPDRYIIAKKDEVSYTSNNKGEITVAGKTIGGYKKDSTIKLPVEIKNCDGMQLNSCCDQNEVGVKLL